MKRFLIGITGSTASGKSFLAKKIKERLQANVLIFDQDNYFYDEKDQPKDQNGEPNFDTPNSLDLNKFKEDYFKLINGQKVVQQKYNYNKPIDDGKDQVIYEPADIIIVEGIFVFYFDQIFESFDITIFVESEMETNIERRILRDKIERGYDENDVRYKFKHHVQDSYDKYIRPFKEKTDLIAYNTKTRSTFNDIIDIIEKKIES